MDSVEVNGERFVYPSVLAEARGVTSHAIRLAIREGALPAREMLGRWLIPLADAEAWQPRPRGGARPGAGRKPKEETATDGN